MGTKPEPSIPLYAQGLQPQPLDPPALDRPAGLRMRVLAVVGALDASAMSAAAALLAAAVPQTRVVTSPDSAHLPSLEHPARFNAGWPACLRNSPRGRSIADVGHARYDWATGDVYTGERRVLLRCIWRSSVRCPSLIPSCSIAP